MRVLEFPKTPAPSAVTVAIEEGALMRRVGRLPPEMRAAVRVFVDGLEAKLEAQARRAIRSSL